MRHLWDELQVFRRRNHVLIAERNTRAFPDSFEFLHEPEAEGKGFSFGVTRIFVQAMGFEQVGRLLETVALRFYALRFFTRSSSFRRRGCNGKISPSELSLSSLRK